MGAGGETFDLGTSSTFCGSGCIVKTTEWIPILLLSDHRDVRAVVNTIQAGAVAFIEKPFNKEQILDGVQSAIPPEAGARR